MADRVAMVNFSAALVQEEAGAHGNRDTYYYSTQKGALIAYLTSTFPGCSIELIGYSKDRSYHVTGSERDRVVHLPNVNSENQILLSLIFNLLLPWHLLRSRPSLVYAYTDGVLHPYITAVLMAKVLRVPVFIDLRNLPYCCYIERSRPWYIRMGVKITDNFCLRHSDAIICISEMCRRAVSENGDLPARTVVVPSCAAALFFQEEAGRTARGERMIFASWGVLDRTRQLDVLIRGFARAKEIDPMFNAELVIIGDGDHRGELEALGRTLSPQDITFKGYMGQQELAAYLHTVSVAVIAIPPDREYFRTSSPLKLSESLALGIPMLASNIEPNRIVAEESLGILCDHSESGYADAFLEFSRAPAGVMEIYRENCRRIRDSVRPARVFSGIGDLLKEQITGGPA
ncbi:MAG: glycosyltransferase [Methanoculleus sp.]